MTESSSIIVASDSSSDAVVAKLMRLVRPLNGLMVILKGKKSQRIFLVKGEVKQSRIQVHQSALYLFALCRTIGQAQVRGQGFHSKHGKLERMADRHNEFGELRIRNNVDLDDGRRSKQDWSLRPWPTLARCIGFRRLF